MAGTGSVGGGAGSAGAGSGVSGGNLGAGIDAAGPGPANGAASEPPGPENGYEAGFVTRSARMKNITPGSPIRDYESLLHLDDQGNVIPARYPGDNKTFGPEIAGEPQSAGDPPPVGQATPRPAANPAQRVAAAAVDNDNTVDDSTGEVDSRSTGSRVLFNNSFEWRSQFGLPDFGAPLRAIAEKLGLEDSSDRSTLPWSRVRSATELGTIVNDDGATSVVVGEINGNRILNAMTLTTSTDGRQSFANLRSGALQLALDDPAFVPSRPLEDLFMAEPSQRGQPPREARYGPSREVDRRDANEIGEPDPNPLIADLIQTMTDSDRVDVEQLSPEHYRLIDRPPFNDAFVSIGSIEQSVRDFEISVSDSSGVRRGIGTSVLVAEIEDNEIRSAALVEEIGGGSYSVLPLDLAALQTLLASPDFTPTMQITAEAGRPVSVVPGNEVVYAMDSPEGVDLSDLPVFDRIGDRNVTYREDMRHGFAQCIRVVGCNEDRTRVIGVDGRELVSVPRDAFSQAPKLDQRVTISRAANGKEHAEPAHELELGL